MRRIVTTTVGLLALIFVAACVPISQFDETGTVATAAPQPAATLAPDTPAPSPTPGPPTPAPTETPAPLEENVAVLGFGRASTNNELAHLAIDGDLETLWSAGVLPMQWLAITLDDIYLVDRIEMVVAQAPSGPTTHEIWLESGSGVRSLYKRLVDVHTEDGQILDVVIDPPRNVNELLIRTLENPSWVAWREVRVFGSPSLEPMPGIGAARWKLRKVAVGLELPVQIANAADGSGRLFVLEQKGRIRIVKDGLLNDTPFLDIADRISCCGERGLIGIAFPPDYAAKQYFYLSYTNVDGHTIISRFTITADPDRANPGSEEILLAIDQPYETHNGGRIVFSPQDGYLYIGSGDGGSFNDPENSAQDPGSLRGKILRIDVESGLTPYAIPASNPFVQVDDHRDEIWALGLRNPWGFAFDALTGDLYIPDVGNSKLEELNYQPATSPGGENYGWRILEGTICFDFLPMPCSADGMTSPVTEYAHSQGCAIVGGAAYRGSSYSALQGVFIFADFCSGRIWGLARPDADASPGSRSSSDHSQDGWQSILLLSASVPLSSIGEDEEGNVYVTGYQDGSISMITER